MYQEVLMVNKPKNRKIAVLLAFSGAIIPGLHKFYLKQPIWGILYLLLSWNPIPRVASVLEGVWYLSQDGDEFDLKFNAGVTAEAKPVKQAVDVAHISAIADAVRQLDQLRTDGLISEYEFEQKRRQLLDRIA